MVDYANIHVFVLLSKVFNEYAGLAELAEFLRRNISWSFLEFITGRSDAEERTY